MGSLVCQIGKIHGAKVIGIAGTDEKCRWLREEVKIDAALNYKSPTFRDEFKDAVGNLDVFFDNVGGEILDFALTRLNKGARIALCGKSKHKELLREYSESPMTFARCHLRLQCVRYWLDAVQDLYLHVTDTPNPKGLSSYMNLIGQRAKIEGFIV